MDGFFKYYLFVRWTICLFNPLYCEGGWHSMCSFECRVTPESFLLRMGHKCSLGLKGLYWAAYVETDGKSKLSSLNKQKTDKLLRTEFVVKSDPQSDKSINDNVPCNSIWGFRICIRSVTCVATVVGWKLYACNKTF